MNIRSVHTHEIPQIAAIHERTATVAYAHIFPDQPFPRAETLSRWQTFPGQILVAEVEKMIVGFAAFDVEELHAQACPHIKARDWSSVATAAGAASSLWVLQENHAARNFLRGTRLGTRWNGADSIWGGGDALSAVGYGKASRGENRMSGLETERSAPPQRTHHTYHPPMPSSKRTTTAM
ncbi:MAG: hypothetical protein R2867_35350 [Caldilineaceae bacterium]